MHTFFKLFQQQKARPVVIFMTDHDRYPDPYAVIDKLPKNATIIVRDYNHPSREALARNIIKLAKPRGIKTLIAGDKNLAIKLRADGIHRPEWQHSMLPIRTPLLKSVTSACHSMQALSRAKNHAIDHCLVSPVFPTGSHAGSDALEVHRFARLTANSRCSIIALGGINEAQLKRLKGLSIKGIAAISGLM